MALNETVSFESLAKIDSTRVIFCGICGSYAHGTNTEESDRDTISVFVMERDSYLAIGKEVTQITDAGNGNRFYSRKNYLELATAANPNILESLFTPQDYVLKTTLYWQKLQENR